MVVGAFRCLVIMQESRSRVWCIFVYGQKFADGAVLVVKLMWVVAQTKSPASRARMPESKGLFSRQQRIVTRVGELFREIS